MFKLYNRKDVHPRDVMSSYKYTEYERTKALKYEKILFDAEVEEMQARKHKEV